MWRPSPPPDDGWDGEEANRERNWEVQVVNEEIDTFEEKHYEYKWPEWRRRDGTNTTWSPTDASDITPAWDRKRSGQREGEARLTQSVRIPLVSGQLWHEDNTVEIMRGVAEKRQIGLRNERRLYSGWDNCRLSDSEEVEEDPAEQPEVPQSSESDTSHGRGAGHVSDLSREANRTGLAHRAPAAPESSSDEMPPSNALQNARHRRLQRVISSSDSDSPPLLPVRTRTTSGDVARTERPIRPLPRRSRPESWHTSSTLSGSSITRRAELQMLWRHEASRVGALASVTFVNDVNSDEVPPGLDNFKYCERHYVRAQGIPGTADMSGALVACECDTSCDDAEQCGCQRPSELVDDHNAREFAYTDQGLFRFNVPQGVVVIECNRNCLCDVYTCPNRVAQRPRNVPIEIFRTQDCGWGARAAVSLVKGKVLGLYTGELITREDAAKRTGDAKSYIFDLDMHEMEGEEADQPKYSVDASSCGNWTRFVNHSCEPNVKVYPVVWDTVPEQCQPYLAFVTTQDIPERTELTIDYEPQASAVDRRDKGKGKSRIPPGARPCTCGTSSCRGWVRV